MLNFFRNRLCMHDILGGISQTPTPLVKYSVKGTVPKYHTYQKLYYFCHSSMSSTGLGQMSYSILCSFEKIVGSPCGLSKTRPNDTRCVTLLSCNKSIKSHLRQCRLPENDIRQEWQLILARAGLFETNNASSLTVCPYHRDNLGIYWKVRPTKCRHPLHKTRSKSHRSMNWNMCKEIRELWGVLVQVGAGIWPY